MDSNQIVMLVGKWFIQKHKPFQPLVIFSTNSTGGFSDSAYIESESGLGEGKYEIQFFDDADNDGNADQGKKRIYCVHVCYM
jgi:hypothetical protein